MKTAYIIAGVVALLWVKGRKTEQAKNQIADTTASQRGSDWIGTMWDRLSGADLHAPGYTNIAAGPVADPGKVGALNAGILPGWDGAL